MRISLFDKVRNGYVSRAEEIREAAVLAKRRTDKREREKAKVLLIQFIKTKDFTFPEAKEQYLYIFPQSRAKPALSVSRLLNQIRAITGALEDYTDTWLGRLKKKQAKDLRELLVDLSKKTKNLLNRMRK